jgi:hypothetical protein
VQVVRIFTDMSISPSLSPRQCPDRYAFHEEIREAPRCLSKWPHHVEVPHREGPRDGDGLKCLRREMSLSSVELAPLAATHDVLGVRNSRGPVEPLSESFLDKSPRTGVMPARAGLDLAT